MAIDLFYLLEEQKLGCLSLNVISKTSSDLHCHVCSLLCLGCSFKLDLTVYVFKWTVKVKFARGRMLRNIRA